jgi:hypothetical protein
VPAVRPLLLRSVKAALDVDNQVSRLVLIARTDFADGVDPSIRAELERRWAELGGPQAAADESLPDPWAHGSVFGRTIEALDSLIARRPGDVELLCTRIAVEYEILSSYWWGLPRFTLQHRDYLLGAIEADRKTLDLLIGSEEAVYRASALMQQVHSLAGEEIPAEFAPFLERLRLDIVNNQALMPGEGRTTP